MYGFLGSMVFCRFHPHKRCEHFCEEHRVQLCSICLREKHRTCPVSDENSYKDFYGKLVRDATHVIEDRKNDLIGRTDGVVHALDTGISRLGRFRRDVDDVVRRLHEMKEEVEGQRAGVRQTSQSLRDIERSLTTATELRQCKQCFNDIDIERLKFERKQKKVIQTPGRFEDEAKIHFTELTKTLKSIKHDLDAELSASRARLQIPGVDVSRPVRELSNFSPFMDITKKFAKVRANRGRVSMAASFPPDGRTFRRTRLGDDGRYTQYKYEKRVKLPALPGITQKSPPNDRRTVIKFTGYGPKSANGSWHMT